MSDNAWKRFKPSKNTEGSKKSAYISWQSDVKKTIKKSETSKPDLFSIWDEQRRMEAEDKKIAKELADAKKKAKELQRTLRKNKYGEIKTQFPNKLKSLLRKITGYFVIVKNWSLNNKKFSVPIVVAVISVFSFLTIFDSSKDTTSTLGETTDKIVSPDQLSREKPVFSLLIPSGENQDSMDIRKTSPDGAAPSYTFLDSIGDSQVFRVSQQQVPEGFDIEKTTKEFQATNIIQLDDTKIYHGFSERAKIQSLIFIKNDRLVTISSPQKFDDSQWVGYITSLQ